MMIVFVVWSNQGWFQLWSCDRAPYLLPRESFGAWACASCTLYDLLPPRLRTSSNVPSSRFLKSNYRYSLKFYASFTYNLRERITVRVTHKYNGIIFDTGRYLSHPYRLPHGPVGSLLCCCLEFKVGKYSSLCMSGAIFFARGLGLATTAWIFLKWGGL